MAIIGGNTTNHRTKEDVIKGIKAYCAKLGVAVPDLSKLNWNELRRGETYLWGKCVEAFPSDYGIGDK